jgi:hypothetical protein
MLMCEITLFELLLGEITLHDWLQHRAGLPNWSTITSAEPGLVYPTGRSSLPTNLSGCI